MHLMRAKEELEALMKTLIHQVAEEVLQSLVVVEVVGYNLSLKGVLEVVGQEVAVH